MLELSVCEAILKTSRGLERFSEYSSFWIFFWGGGRTFLSLLLREVSFVKKVNLHAEDFSGTCELSTVIAVSLSVSLLQQSDGHDVDLYELL